MVGIHKHSGFNSILVRLKVTVGMCNAFDLVRRFNSILVRLKAKTWQAAAWRLERFQFHTGSIKRQRQYTR